MAQLEDKATPTLPKGITIYKTLTFALDFSDYGVTFTLKKLCKYFVLLTSVIATKKNDVSD